MSVSPDGTFALIANGSKVLKISLTNFSSSTFAADGNYYGVFIHPSKSLVYLGDAENFASEGTVHVHNYAGDLLFSVGSGGVGPNGFALYK
jgi:hypothetical protein